MAESSRFWDTSGAVGDGADTYSAYQVRELLRAAFTGDRYASEGVLAGVLNSLAVTGATSPVAVDTGCALVNGIYYQNTASVNVAVPTPSSGTTGHRVVLQALWGTTATVRIALISSADGTSSAPSLSQDENSRWEISLATLTIDTAGAITLTDARDYCHYSTALVHRRRGGSSSSWNSTGSTTYRVGGTKEQCGVATLTWDDNDDSDQTTVTFPSAFSQKPLVFLTLMNGGGTQERKLLATVYSVSASSFQIEGQRTDGSGDITTTASVMWRAVGSE